MRGGRFARGSAAMALAFLGCCTVAVTWQSRADTPQATLPDVGASQVFAASVHVKLPMALPPGGENSKYPADLPHDQTGTFTVARTASDSVHLTAADGLDALDQTLHLDDRGSIAQSSPASSFIDALNYVAAVIASEPAGAQTAATWKVNVQVAGMDHKSPSVSVPMSVELLSVADGVARIHAEGDSKSTIRDSSIDTSLVIELTLKAGRVGSYTGTTTYGIATPMINLSMGETTSLTAK